MRQRIKKSIFSISKGIILATAILVGAFQAEDLHHSYLRYNVGSEVVKIQVPEVGSGTGFHVKAKSGDVYIMTNAHVCEMASNGKKLQVISEGRPFGTERDVVFVSKSHDICLVEGLPGHDSGLELASDYKIGEKIHLIGHPNGRPLMVSNGELVFDDAKVTIAKFAVYSEEDAQKCTKEGGQLVTYPSFFGDILVCVSSDYAFQISAITFPGNSGSPVVNKFGNVIGLLYAGRNDVINDGYTVKLQFLKEVLDNY